MAAHIGPVDVPALINSNAICLGLVEVQHCGHVLQRLAQHPLRPGCGRAGPCSLERQSFPETQTSQSCMELQGAGGNQ